MSMNSEYNWGEALVQGLHPAFVVEEESLRLVYANDIISAEYGDVIGKTCYEVFCNRSNPCAFCPGAQQDNTCYYWECYDEVNKHVSKVSNTWKTIDGKRYRLAITIDATDIMELNRSVVDYLWLMQQLSNLQVSIMDDQAQILENILIFLCEHFIAKQVVAVRDGKVEYPAIICEKGKAPTKLLDNQLIRESDFTEELKILDESCTFYFYGVKSKTEWLENRQIILNVIKLYLENELLMRRIAWESTHDASTNLQNRAAFRRDTMILFNKLPEVAVLFLDIDNLKMVNDTFGHEMGDRLIKRAAEVLLEVSSNKVFTYRMGGDEFVVVCNMGEEQAQELMELIACKIMDNKEIVAVPQIGISKGMAWSKQPVDIEALVSEADERMYEDKRARKARLSKSI